MAWTAVHSTVFTGPVAAPASPGGVVQDGWTDTGGNVWSISSSGVLVAANGNGLWNTGSILRPASEALADAQMTIRRYVGTGDCNLYIMLRNDAVQSGCTCYIASFNGGALGFGTIVAGSYTGIGSTVGVSVASGFYDLTFSIVQTNTTTTTLALSLADTSGNVLGTAGMTDTTTQLQGTSGRQGAFTYITSGAPCQTFSRATTYTDVATTATAYTLSGPASGATGSPATFTVAPNGNAGAAIVVTPSDGGNGGTFSPTTVTFASGTSTAHTFTYTPASAGSKTITATNNGGLTNPSSAAFTAISYTTLGVTSAAAKFSPGNWRGDTGRGGTAWRQTWNNGAWFEYTWTASASPVATLLLASSSTASTLSYFLNGVLTDNVAATGNVSISGILASTTNRLLVYVRASTQSARWNSGTNVVQVQGLQIDTASAAGSATGARPWAIIVGDSITEGINAGVNADSSIYDYSFLVGRALDALGYDTCVNACGFSGYIVAGDSTQDVPAYYFIYQGAYQDGSSRWNKIDSGISLLDSASQLSSYGATGTPPALILINLGTNEAHGGSDVPTFQAAVTQCITALRTAAPAAVIAVLVPFGLHYTPVFSTGASYVAALAAAVAAHSTDAKVLLIDLGADVSQSISAGLWGGYDNIHLPSQGHAYVAPMVTSKVVAALGGGGGTVTAAARTPLHR